MTKKKAKAKQSLTENELMGQLFNNIGDKFGGMDTAELATNCAGYKIPYYSERYIRDSNVYITGKIEMYVGDPGSGKSSYGFHVGSEFIDDGGYFFFVETENKISPVTLRANLGAERFESGRVQFIPAGSVDMETGDDDDDKNSQSWQGIVSGIIAHLRKEKLQHLPIYILVDSILGAAGSESRKEYFEEGQSKGRSTSDMARAASITRFLSNLASDLRDTNILVAFTNHRKEKIAMGGKPVLGDKTSIPGGSSLIFHCSLVLMFMKGAKEGDMQTVGRAVRVSCYKNSFGGEERRMSLSFRYDHVTDAEGNFIMDKDDEYIRLVYWNWHAATGQLLRDFCCKDGFDEKVSSAVSRKLINLHYKGGKFTCPELDMVEDSDQPLTAEALGKALEAHPDVEKVIRGFPRLAICQYPTITYEEG